MFVSSSPFSSSFFFVFVFFFFLGGVFVFVLFDSVVNLPSTILSLVCLCACYSFFLGGRGGVAVVL